MLISAFCKIKYTPGSEQLYSTPGYKSVFRNKTSNSGGQIPVPNYSSKTKIFAPSVKGAVVKFGLFFIYQ